MLRSKYIFILGLVCSLTFSNNKLHASEQAHYCGIVSSFVTAAVILAGVAYTCHSCRDSSETTTDNHYDHQREQEYVSKVRESLTKALDQAELEYSRTRTTATVSIYIEKNK